MPPTPPGPERDLAALLAAPAGVLSLICRTHGCFHEETFELSLAWTPDEVTLRSSGTDERLDRAQLGGLLRRVIAAASLEDAAPDGRTTTHRECTLAWEVTAGERAGVRGERRWSGQGLSPEEARSIVALMDPQKWPAQLDLSPRPLHSLFSIAEAPLAPEAPPRRYVTAVLEIDARDEAAAGRELVGLLRAEDLPSLASPVVLRKGEPGGHTRLKMVCEVGSLLGGPLPPPPGEAPELRALERRIADALAGVGVLRSARYREVPS